MGKVRKKKKPTLPKYTGDLGTGTAAATKGTEVEPITDDKGRNPNNQARRRRRNVLEGLKSLSMRQLQAGQAIQEAFCRVEMLSSGGELKEQVDASPKPDACIAAQVDANSALVHVMRPVPTAMRGIVEHVCWHNLPVYTYRKDMDATNRANLKIALDLVANHLRY